MSENLAQAAHLAQAAYATLTVGSTVDSLDRLVDQDFTLIQRQEFASNFPVIVAQYADTLPNGGMGTGLNFTVFADRPTDGQLTLAIRGTDGLAPGGEISDLAAGADIVANGMAYDQIVALVNWWNRATAAPGTLVNQFHLVEKANHDIPADAVVLRPGNNPDTSYVLDAADQLPAFSDINNISARLAADPDQRVEITGHSLGGHLGMLFSVIFPGQAGQVTVFNAPGFKDSSVNQAFIAKMRLGALIPAPGATNIVNVIADESVEGGAPLNLMAGLHSRPGKVVGVPIEKQFNSDEPTPPAALNHSIMVLSDSLAVYKLLADLAPHNAQGESAFTLADYKRLLGQAVNGTAASHEKILDALRILFAVGDTRPLEIGNGATAREQLYKAINELTKADTLYDINKNKLSIEVIAGVAGDYVSAAQLSTANGLAWRYALKELNPFAIIDDTNSIYARYLPGGSSAGALDFYDASTRQGELTQSWLEDRAAMLQRRLDIAAKDENNDVSVVPKLRNTTKSWESDHTYYADSASGYVINQGDQRIHRPHVVFGSDIPDQLSGGSNDDRLYAGRGNDILIGRSGNDYLEGGDGHDIYEYDSVHRSLFSTNPDGHDVILDVDGKGILRFRYLDAEGKAQSTAIAGAALRQSDGSWKTADGRFVLRQDDTDPGNLKITFGAAVDGSITIRNFDFAKAGQSGYMGLRLQAEPVVPTTNTPVSGDLEYLVLTAGRTQAKQLDGTAIDYLQQGNDFFEKPAYGDIPETWLNVSLAPETTYTLSHTSGAFSYYTLPSSVTLRYNEVDEFGNIKRSETPSPGLEDQIYDTSGIDQILAGGGNDRIDAIRGNADVIDAGSGRDVVNAGSGADIVEGGADGTAIVGVSGPVAGGDMVNGGVGDDRLYGNTRVDLDAAIRNSETEVADNSIGDFLSGESGSDWLVSGAANDALLGGDDADILVGGAGNDNLFGDRNSTAPDAGWVITRQTSGNAASGFNYQALFNGVNSVADGAGGQDVLYGGAGEDWAFGGKGDDFVDGGSGRDILFGDEGSDVVIGGADDDVLVGDGATVASLLQGDDYLDGGAGNDTLQGDGGADILIGDAGDDKLSGGDGNDILIGGAGLDQLIGGAGKDTYVFNRGDGTEIIVDSAAGGDDPEASVLVFGEGISRDDIKFRKGSLMVDLGPSSPDDPLAGNDQIHFTNFNGDFPDLTAAIGEIRFADGSVMDYADILAQGFDLDGTALDDAGGNALIGTSVTDRIRGFAGSDELEGRDGDDVLIGDGGSDRLDAGNGNDVLDGGSGNDVLAGGLGSDDYRFVHGDGLDTLVEGSLYAPGLSDAEHSDRIVFGEGVAREDVTLLRTADGNLTVRYGAGDEIVVEGHYNLAGADIERIVFADGQSIEKAELDALEIGVVEGTADADELYGTTGNDQLRGGEGDDWLDGGPVPERRVAGVPPLTGDDQLDGGAGADTYALYWGMGNDRVIETADGQANTLALSPGTTLDSIKTRRIGDDLRVELRGGGGSATVQGFFSAADAADWQIAGDAEGGQSLLALYEAQSAAENEYAADAMEDYKQGLLGEWRARGQIQGAFALPTHAYVKSTWSQTISEWTRLVPALPEPILQTQTFVNDPVTYTTIGGYGLQQGGRILQASTVGGSVIQRLVDPVVELLQSDAAVIEAQASSNVSSDALSYTFNAGGGGPFGSSRTYSYSNGFVVNTVTESSTEGWVPLTLREDGLDEFSLTYQQVTENPVIEQIEAGAGSNVITGAIENDPYHVALIDGGAGDDEITAGRFDFASGGEGDDVITGGAYAYGGSGFDLIEGAAFISGGADDDLLYGGEGETTFSFRAEEAGSDLVQDRNGLTLTDFAVRAGFADSTSNLVYGGKFRLGGEASFATIYPVLEQRLGGSANVNDYLSQHLTYADLDLGESGLARYAVLNEGRTGFPRGVPDQLNRSNAPYYSDGYYSWVYNSVEDMMRDFSDLGIPFAGADVSQIPEVDLSDFTGDTYNHQALRPFFNNGILDKDVVRLDGAAGLAELTIGYGPVDENTGRETLRILWEEDKVIDIELPKAGDLIGFGVEEIQAGGDALYIGDAIAIADQNGSIGTPFEDYLVGTGGDDRLSGFAQWDFLDGGAGNDVLSGGVGIDEFFFEAGDGVDRIVDPDADDIIVFGNGVSPAQIRLGLGLGSLMVGYGENGEAIHFEGFDPADVQSSPMFSALNFYTIEPGEVLPDGSIEEIWTLTGELTYADVLSQGFDIDGSSASESLTGTNIEDRFDGRGGDDHLVGGEGGDSYFFSAGDGVDVVEDRVEAGAVNRVVFRDFAEADITGSKDGQFVVLHADSGEEVRIGWDMETGRGVDQVEFADGAVWGRAYLDQLEASNSAPVVNAPIGSVGATEDMALAFTVPVGTFTDPDAGDTLTFAATLSNGDALPGWLSFDTAMRTFSGTPGNDDVGSLSVTLTATDADGAAVSDTFSLNVINSNDAPELVTGLAGQALVEDQAFEYVVPAGTFADVDTGDVLTYAATLFNGAALPEWLVFDEASNTFSGVPGNADVGSLSIRVTATDAAGESASTTFALTVANVNDVPVLANPLTDQAVTAGTPFSYTVPADAFADADAGDAVTLSARLSGGGDLPSWLAFDAETGTFTGTFSGIPGASNVGELDVEVVATDNAGAAAGDRFLLTVNPAPGLTLTGSDAADTLTGGFGNDVIDGLAGADLMAGGDGDDRYTVDQAGDVTVENPGEGHDVVFSSASYVLPDHVEALVITGTLNRNATGNALVNTLTGNDAANRLDGGGGADVLIGGLGNDVYVVDDAADQVFEAAAAGTDAVQSSVSYMLADNIENLTLTGTGAIDATGNALANTLTGNAAANTLSGGAGNDRLIGGEGIDILLGGIGNDTYVIDNIDEFIIEQSGEGTDTVQAPFDYVLAEHFENLILTGLAVSATGNAAANRLTGNALDNVLAGLDGNDVLNGAAGADTMIGGMGNDIYVVNHAGDLAVEQAGGGSDLVQAAVNYTLGDEVENLQLTGTADTEGSGNALTNRLTGNAGANVLRGLAGNDILDGRAGADQMIGGVGNDSYYVDQSADAVVELEGEGMDVVLSSATYSLSANIENLTLTGTSAIDGSGNAQANILLGNTAANTLSGHDGNDLLDGKAGADLMIGGAGNDSYVVDNIADSVSELADEGIDTVQSAVEWALGEHFEKLVLTGSAVINGNGNALDNMLTGNAAANVLTGFDGNDMLDGLGGNDVLIGGLGDDTYVVAQTGDVVTEEADRGIDTVRSAITWTLGQNIENLLLTGTGAIRGTGNTLANVIIGNAANNQIDGLAGADTMVGGLGNDSYIVDDAGDQVIELAGEGVDLVRTALDYRLTAEVENLTLTGAAAVNGSGNMLDNAITGNAAANVLDGAGGNDVLNGAAGADTLIGGTGDDAYIIDNAGDLVVEQEGGGVDTVNSALTHVLSSYVENLNLTGAANRNGTGNALDNTISGNRGINILNGLGGNDVLAGGLGSDVYRFDAGFGHDVIAEDDATAGNLDRIQFGAGITSVDIGLARLDDDLVVHTADRQHSIQVMDWFAGASYQVERIEFANGTFWDAAAIESGAMQSVDMPGLMRGDSSASVLLGQIGNTILEGGGGDDVLDDQSGNNLFSGGGGNDSASGGAGGDLFVGGSGNDILSTGAGSNVISYNAGDGIDTVYADAGAENTLSLGGDLSYGDLSLSRDNNDLVLNTGTDDRIVLKDWYVGNSSLLNLQVILDATAEFDVNSADPLYNRRVQNFDFLGMVGAFDAARMANPGLSRWALGDALSQFHLSGSDEAAMGGDLAYWYARNNSLTGIGLNAAQQIIGAPGFGAEAQALREFSGLQEGLVRLS